MVEVVHQVALKEHYLSGLHDWFCLFANFSAFANVLAERVTKSLDLQKYALADPLCPDADFC